MKFLYASIIEAAIAGHIVQSALDKGWTVSVNDGEEWVVKKSDNYDKITDAMNSTSDDTLRFHDGVKTVGTVLLVWGNGSDLITDHSADHNGFDDFMDTMFNFANEQ